MAQLHETLVEGLNKFVEMIVAPINARIQALEQRAEPGPEFLTREQILQMLREREEEREHGLRDNVRDMVDDKLDDDLHDRIREYINDNVSVTISSDVELHCNR
jgi:hypothetical protein